LIVVGVTGGFAPGLADENVGKEATFPPELVEAG
jgi:hypothetical protein